MSYFDSSYFEYDAQDALAFQLYDNKLPHLGLNPQADEFYPGPEDFGFDPYSRRFRYERPRAHYYDHEKYRQPLPEELLRAARYMPSRRRTQSRTRLPLNFPSMHQAMRTLQHAPQGPNIPPPHFPYYDRPMGPPMPAMRPTAQPSFNRQRTRIMPGRPPKFPKKRSSLTRSGQRKYSYRSKQDKIDEVLGRLRYKYNEQGKLSEQQEVLRGEDTLRIDVKRYTALQQIESVIEKIERDSKTDLLRVDFPVSQKNRFQKKGFIAYLKCGSAEQAEQLQEQLVKIKDPKYPEKCLFRVTVAVELRKDEQDEDRKSDESDAESMEDEKQMKCSLEDQIEQNIFPEGSESSTLHLSFEKLILDSKTTQL